MSQAQTSLRFQIMSGISLSRSGAEAAEAALCPVVSSEARLKRVAEAVAPTHPDHFR
ncbi:MAG: hypothetical protein HLUCCX14_12615 [Marinobacter excellens HL-55]|uniref:Uncharacterized protein n=1 Tax=Marinobacter excellens HL-55 TaxID=1305731 RepID=A0A0P8CWS8_9GAMM|nr:MAG: hypothetical protein HLUCCX14_12615 [Marinobacter excellens HL-55]